MLPTMERFDAAAPLPGAPEPWASTEMPTRRDGPPWHMTEMIEAEPALARRLLDRLATPDSAAARLGSAVREAASSGRSIVVVGCGTSDHGAQATAAILRDALATAGLGSAAGGGGTPIAMQALEASLDASFGGPRSLVIGISHEGSTDATNRALSVARTSGATTAIVTVSGASPGAGLADIVLTTGELDQSWCHTIGYISPILAAAAVGAHISGIAVDAAAVADLLAHGLAPTSEGSARGIAAALGGLDRILVIGSGVDRVAARELALKIEEGAHIPATMRDLETLLHGHLAGTDERTGLVVILADSAARGARTARTLAALRACREIGIRVAGILSAIVDREVDSSLTPAGRILVADAPTLAGPVAALAASAVPLQVLTLALASNRGVDPDPIRRDEPRYLAAAEVAG
jgi:glucosamine--fructose-6-phosphate aminotransferase (isomerizing)